MAEDPDLVSICNVGDAPCQLSIAPAFNGVGLVRLRPGERWARPDSRSLNEIERLRAGLEEIAHVIGDNYNRCWMRVKAREILRGAPESRDG